MRPTRRGRSALLASIVALSFGCAANQAPSDFEEPASPIKAAAAEARTLSTVRVNGVELGYQSRGRGETVVFVHGSLVDYREWGPVAQQLENQYHTITYSRRYNYPNTNPLTDTDHSAVVEGEDLAALIGELELGPVDLVAVSYGAYTAMVVALRHPHLVRSLTIVEPPLLRWAPELPGGEAHYDEFFVMWRASRDAFVRGDSEAALRVALDWFVGPNGMEQLPPEVLAVLKSNSEEWRALTLSSNAFPQITPEQVHKLECPVLMISGGRSYPVLQLIDTEIEKRLANGRPRRNSRCVQRAASDLCRCNPHLSHTALALSDGGEGERKLQLPA